MQREFDLEVSGCWLVVQFNHYLSKPIEVEVCKLAHEFDRKRSHGSLRVLGCRRHRFARRYLQPNRIERYSRAVICTEKPIVVDWKRLLCQEE